MNTKSLPIGAILNRKYRIEKTLGSGGFGITYLCRHIHTDSYYAVKEHFLDANCIRDAQTQNISLQGIKPENYEKFRKKFVMEAQTLKTLNHPNIVNIVEEFDENNTSYFVMPYIEGRTFKQVIKQGGRLSYEMVVNYIAQLTEAVGYIHDQGILHRDIKPENIMITPFHRVVLIDFGTARAFVQDQIEGLTTLFTRIYAPIEQYSGSMKGQGTYSDIYSIGAVFYHAATQQMPLEATMRVINDTLLPPKSINPAIPEAANRTIMKAMSVKSADRYQRIEEFRKDLLGEAPTIEKVVTIGRNPNNDEVIKDINVSRNHLQIIQDAGGSFRLIDHSTNGTFVNERRIHHDEVMLHSNDTVKIGNTTLPWQSYFIVIETDTTGTGIKSFWKRIFIFFNT
ncbi:hypothetical protein FACS189437_02570 [Bacteroidia bacterium]|nr:hypothetical protein FACS189437_02570 [Bacteroidia bacterium]